MVAFLTCSRVLFSTLISSAAHCRESFSIDAKTACKAGAFAGGLRASNESAILLVSLLPSTKVCDLGSLCSEDVDEEVTSDNLVVGAISIAEADFGKLEEVFFVDSPAVVRNTTGCSLYSLTDLLLAELVLSTLLMI